MRLTNSIIVAILLCLVGLSGTSVDAQVCFPDDRHSILSLGIVDRAGNIIVKPNYSEIQYLGYGFYLCRELGRNLSLGEKYSLFNHAGKLLDVKVPEGTSFCGVYDFGSRLSQGKDHPSSLPPDAVLCIRRGSKFGLCDLQGAILVNCDYGFVESANGGQPLICKLPLMTSFDSPGLYDKDLKKYQSQRVFAFSSKERKLRQLEIPGLRSVSRVYSDGMRTFCCADNPGAAGYLNDSGEIAIQPIFGFADAFLRGQAIVADLPKSVNSRLEKYVINKQGTRLSPIGIDVQTRWAGAYIVRKEREALMDESCNIVYDPSNGPIYPQADGTFDHQGLVISNKGNVINPDKDFGMIYFKDIQIRCARKGSISDRTSSFFGSWDDLHCTTEGLVGGTDLRLRFFDSKMHFFNLTPLSPLPINVAAKVLPYKAFAEPEPDRLIVVTPPEEGPDDSSLWTGVNMYSMAIGPVKLFARVLRNHDLFKMSKAEILDVLGYPKNKKLVVSDEEAALSLISGGCTGAGAIRVKMTFEGDRLKSWNFCGAVDCPKITTDVVLVPEVLQKKTAKITN